MQGLHEYIRAHERARCISGNWSARLDSNQRLPGPKPGALPDCATGRKAEIRSCILRSFCGH